MRGTSRRRDERGNAYVEYVVIAVIVLLATVAFYQQGRFRGVRGNLESTFDAMASRITR